MERKIQIPETRDIDSCAYICKLEWQVGPNCWRMSAGLMSISSGSMEKMMTTLCSQAKRSRWEDACGWKARTGFLTYSSPSSLAILPHSILKSRWKVCTRNVSPCRAWFSDFVETPDVAVQAGREKFSYKYDTQRINKSKEQFSNCSRIREGNTLDIANTISGWRTKKWFDQTLTIWKDTRKDRLGTEGRGE